MWESEPSGVWVALGRQHADTVVPYAGAEARRRGCGVHVVHVARPDVAAPPDGGPRHPGLDLLADAARRLRAGPDDVRPVSTELCRGFVVPCLTAESARGAVLVVGRAKPAPGPRPSSVSGALAGRAHAAVLVVPNGWVERPSAGPAVVVAGADLAQDGAMASPDVVRAAVDEAARRRGRLRLVHARRWPDRPDRVDAAQVRSAYAAVLATRPEVPVEVEAVDQSPPTALLDRSRDAAVVVLGRRRARPRPAAPLGPVATAVLHGSARPTLVVDPVAGAVVRRRSALTGAARP